MSEVGPVLAVDTSTRASVVVVGGEEPMGVSVREVRHRHGSHVLEQIDEVLAEAGLGVDDVGALAVGTGPGSFTGLRVGLATVKTMAYARGLALVGIASSDALRRASGLPEAVVVMPAGAHDHYLARPAEDPLLVAPGDLAEAVADAPVVAIDMPPDLLGQVAQENAATALRGLPASLLALARERLAAGEMDDAAELTPVYVALPRGVKRAAEDLGWSPDLR